MFSYIGGKKFHTKHINPKFPKTYSGYCEPFSGAFWTYFMSDVNTTPTIYNDAHPYMTNLFRCASLNPLKLKSMMLAIEPQNPNTFISFRDEVFNRGLTSNISEPDFDLAVKFAYIQTQIFAGNTLSAKSKITLLDKTKYRSKYEQLIDKLSNKKYTDKLSNITNFENLDFEECINTYDGSDMLFYIDPPYFNCEHYYTIDTDDVHNRLSKCLSNVKGKIVLSYYWFDGVTELYPMDKFNYSYYDINCQNGTRKQNTTESRKELVIRNFE